MTYKRTPYRKEINTPLSINAGETDRFQFKLYCNDVLLHVNCRLIFEIIVKIIYDVLDKTAECKSMIFYIQPPLRIVQGHIIIRPNKENKPLILHNINQLEEIANRDKTIKSEVK